jgi:acetate kinase
MATRSGDLDPSIVPFVARGEAMSFERIERVLNQESGLLGISGVSGDMRELLRAAPADPAAALAIECFCYRARKYLGAYTAALEGVDAIVFGGGIGENAPEIRARIIKGMEWCGVELDRGRNNAAAGRDGRISGDGSRVEAWVIAVDEGAHIALETARVFGLVGS